MNAHSAPSVGGMRQNILSNVDKCIGFDERHIINSAKNLTSCFPLTDLEALVLTIIRDLASKSESITRRNIRQTLFSVGVDEDDPEIIPTIDEIFALVFPNKKPSEAPAWLEYLWKERALKYDEDEIEIPEYVRAASLFYKTDEETIRVMRHAMESKSALCLKIDFFIEFFNTEIVKCLVEKEDIPCFILKETGGNTSYYYIKAALQAYHKRGIVLFDFSLPEDDKYFIQICKKLGLRFGILRSAKSESDDENTENGFPRILTIPYISFKAVPLSGDGLKNVAAKYFNSNEEFLRIIENAGINAASLCNEKVLINHIVQKKDWKSLERLLEEASKVEISEDTMKSSAVRSGYYDLSILNTSMPLSVVEKMAEKAKERRTPLRILAYGAGSGTGKSAFAYHLAEILGLKLMVRRPSDIILKYIGESEAAVSSAFREAEITHSILLFDEAESYLAKKIDGTSSGSRSYNDLTNCFLVEMERFSGIMICTTNHNEFLESSFIRRFHRAIEFKYPKATGIRKLFSSYFHDIHFREKDIDMICETEAIGPGDFSNLKEVIDYMEKEDITDKFIIDSLYDTALARGYEGKNDKKMIGFH